MRAVLILLASVMSVTAFAQGRQITMYIRPPRAVLCDRLDYAKLAVQQAMEATRDRRAARPFPPGCHVVKPNLPVVLLDQFDNIAYVGINAAPLPPRLWVHVDALGEAPEAPPDRRRR